MPQQLYTRAPRRPQEDMQHYAPLLSSQIPGGGAPKPRVSDAVQRHITETQQIAQLRNTITAAFAAAIDQHAQGYTNPQETRIAEELQQRVIHALTSPSSTNSPPSSHWSSDASHSNPKSPESRRRSWADVARDPQISNRGSSRPLNPAKIRPSQPAKLKEDVRIFIAISNPEIRLQQLSPFAVRQAICKSIAGTTLRDIPTASPINTGWAITAANQDIRGRLVTQENQELLVRALGGDAVRTPERWINYAVQGLVEEKVCSQTGKQPVSCRTSRHGANHNGLTTWIISYKEPVRSFRLFGTSQFSKEIHKHPTIQRHNPGCQGYCNAARCTQIARCVHCVDRTDRHQGQYGDNCPHKALCANCHGPHPASHTNCPAAPRRVNGHVVKPTKTELKAIRRAGKIAQQHLYRTVEVALGQATLQPEALPVEATETVPPHSPTQRQDEDRRAPPSSTTASYASSATTGREKRPSVNSL
ncbi:hypothetical protein PtrSN002B_011558 [Pyrenophora tritici-repentis]|nr:hypothetical protein PtrSN001A_011346 [Pyrenophora tritici-repentis]KAI1526891.1 hypothetical protein PtrSN002B_011558 [Pyrenophora tritici-repentis]